MKTPLSPIKSSNNAANKRVKSNMKYLYYLAFFIFAFVGLQVFFLSHKTSVTPSSKLIERKSINDESTKVVDNVIHNRRSHLRHNNTVFYSEHNVTNMTFNVSFTSHDVKRNPISDSERNIKKDTVENNSVAVVLKEAIKTTTSSLAVTTAPIVHPSSNSGLDISNLPAIAVDSSELVMGAIIERSADVVDLHMTIFFVSHAIFDPTEPRSQKIDRINASAIPIYKKLLSNMGVNKRYLSSGQRESTFVKFFCKIRSSSTSNEYVVSGTFLPNKLTIDSNANRRHDIMRCNINDSKDAYLKYGHTSESVYVEVVREVTNPRNTAEVKTESILRFAVPWKSRQSGYLLSRPAFASRYDVWKGYTVPSAPMDNLHMCVSRDGREGWSYLSLSHIAEFIQHHTLLGADHITLLSEFEWSSAYMMTKVNFLKSFIDEGKLSLQSESSTGLNMAPVMNNLVLNIVTLKNFFINSCLFMAKGQAEYVAIWDFNEMFIPKFPYNSLLDVIRAMEGPNGQKALHVADVIAAKKAGPWRGGRGWADEDGHPYCYLGVVKYDIFPSSTNNEWLHQKYISGVEININAKPNRLILPSRVVFQAGMSVAGACNLPKEWSCPEGNTVGKLDSDGELCRFNGTESMYIRDVYRSQVAPKQFPEPHRFDEQVTAGDGKLVSVQTEGYLLSFNFMASPVPPISSKPNNITNEYTTRFATNVLNALQKRNIDKYMLFPLPESAPLLVAPEWVDYEKTFIYNPEEISMRDDPDRYVVKSDNGYFHFEHDFARSDILEHPVANVLPMFSVGNTEVILGSLLERNHDNSNLHLTTFFLNQDLLFTALKGYGALTISDVNLAKWQTFVSSINRTMYKKSGQRFRWSTYDCRIRNSKNSKVYSTRGMFMPNKLTPDANANRNVDILRCPMKESVVSEFAWLSTTNELVSVEIIFHNTSIANFTIPWKTRRVGYALSHPPLASRYESWKGYADAKKVNVTTGNSRDGNSVDKLYMCVPGVESSVSQTSLAMYLEFIQHHLLLGVDHLFMTTAFSWNGLNMARFLTAMKPLINSGSLSVSSHAADNIDLIYSVLGVKFDRDVFKVIQVNMCLYLSKGVADYVAVWDIDEYFIPKPPYTSIVQVIASAEESSALMLLEENDIDKEKWKGGKGWADGDAHPYCFLMLDAVAVFNSDEYVVKKSRWIGDKFPHGHETTRFGYEFKKSIIPTRNIFQAGLHMDGACKLPNKFTGCPSNSSDEFCFLKSWHEFYGATSSYLNVTDPHSTFSTTHKFDSYVADKDAKKINADTQGVIYHIQIHRPEQEATDEALNRTNDYALTHFPDVLDELRDKSLHALVTIPDKIPYHEPGDIAWLKLWPQTVKYVLSKPLQGDISDIPNYATTYGVPDKDNNLIELPAFSRDLKDVFLGSIIERKHDSFDLHLTVFLLCHEMMANNTGRITNFAIRHDMLKPWMSAINNSRSTKYTEYGVRIPSSTTYCKISNTKTDEVYIVRGHYVPNKGTPDANANTRLDTLRCKILDAEAAYYNLAGSEEYLYVEIVQNEVSQVKFKVPWSDRKTGYTLYTPANATKYNPWLAFDKKTSREVKPGNSGGDRFYMCVPGVESPISKKTIAIYAEFMMHHFLLGVDHMFITTTYAWGGDYMDKFLQSMKSFIDEGKMSVSTTAGDFEDVVYSVLGISMHRDNAKIFNVNMCLYYAKGVADYVGIWDIDEYFIPTPPHNSIMDVVLSLAAPKTGLTPIPADADEFEVHNSWKGGPGWADGDGHPFCYLMMQSQAILRSESVPEAVDRSEPWVGIRYSRGIEHEKMGMEFKKSILPTRVVFQAGLHMNGGCHLSAPWNGCAVKHDSDEFCFSEIARHRFGLTIRNLTAEGTVDFTKEQRFDGLIMDRDAKAVKPETDAVIYHFQVNRPYYVTTSSHSSTNEYSKRFFPTVLEHLRHRGIELMATIPIESRGLESVSSNEYPDAKWSKFEDVLAQVRKKGEIK